MVYVCPIFNSSAFEKKSIPVPIALMKSSNGAGSASSDVVAKHRRLVGNALTSENAAMLLRAYLDTIFLNSAFRSAPVRFFQD